MLAVVQTKTLKQKIAIKNQIQTGVVNMKHAQFKKIFKIILIISFCLTGSVYADGNMKKHMERVSKFEGEIKLYYQTNVLPQIIKDLSLYLEYDSVPTKERENWVLKVKNKGKEQDWIEFHKKYAVIFDKFITRALEENINNNKELTYSIYATIPVIMTINNAEFVQQIRIGLIYTNKNKNTRLTTKTKTEGGISWNFKQHDTWFITNDRLGFAGCPYDKNNDMKYYHVGLGKDISKINSIKIRIGNIEDVKVKYKFFI